MFRQCFDSKAGLGKPGFLNFLLIKIHFLTKNMHVYSFCLVQASFLGDGKMFKALDGHILYSGRLSSPKESHWVLSPPTLNRNSVLYVMPLYFKIDCEKANLRIEDGVQNNTYCGSNKPPAFHIYSGNQQLIVSLRRKDGSLEGQRFGLQYFVEYLGKLKLFI